MIYISNLISDSQLAELLARENLGIETIDFSIGENLDDLSRLIDLWRRRMDSMHCTHVSIHGPFLDLNPTSYDSYIYQATWNRFSQAYRAAMAIGADKIVFHTCRIPLVNYSQGWAERMANFWSKFLENHSQLPICLEKVFDDNPKLLKQVLKLVEHPHFTFCLDAAHAHCFSSVPITEWVDVLGPYTSHVHVHDNLGDRDAHLAVGDGNLPWEDLITHFQNMSQPPTWTIENTSLKDIRISLDFLKKHSFPAGPS